jgi:hypothetical protein
MRDVVGVLQARIDQLQAQGETETKTDEPAEEAAEPVEEGES